jgi:hypothetical protein
MQKIKMKSISSGPDGVMHPGMIYSVEDGEGKTLVDGGYATYETAMVSPVSIEKAGKSPNLNKIKAVSESMPKTPEKSAEQKIEWGKK